VVDRRYRIQASDDLRVWETVRLGSDPVVVEGNASGIARVDLPIPNPMPARRYYRIEVGLP
jgi:hypothetical protein